MSSMIADFTSGQDCLAGLHTFLTSGHTLPPVYSGTGNGWIDDAVGTLASVYEVITVTFTSATEFNVTGSISGGLGSGTVGTLFVSSVIRFTVTASTIPFAVGSTIQMQMTAPWQAKVHAPGSQYLWIAPGNDNNSVIRVGLATSSDATGGYFNARTWMFPYWNDAAYAINNAWSAQYRSYAGPYWPLGSGSTQAIRLIARADGNFCYAVAVIGTTMSAVSLGFMDCFHTRDFYQYPCIVGGSMDWDSNALPASTSTAWKWSDSSLRYPLIGSYNYSQGNTEGSELRVRSGASHETFYARWSSVCEPMGGIGPINHPQSANPNWAVITSTYGQSYAGAYMRCNLDGSFPLWPVIIHMGRRDPSASNKFCGVLGKYPFVGRIPAYDATGTMIVKQQIFRDPATRRRIIAVTGGALEDASNFYGLELA